MMKANYTITGVARTRETLRRYAEGKRTNLRSGIIAAALFVESAATVEITDTLYAQPEPDDKPRKRTGNLRASRMVAWSDAKASQPVPAFAADPFATQDVAAGYAFTLDEARALVNDHKKGEFLAVVGYGAYYALYVHEGTAHAPGYKWLTNVLNRDRQLITDVVRGGVAGGTL